MKFKLFYSLLILFITIACDAADLEAIFEKEMRERLSKKPEIIEELREHKDGIPVYEKLVKEHDEKGKLELEKTEPPVVIKEKKRQRDFEPSKDIADKAFKKGDYATALKHYEALGEDGDSEASMTAGFIYADGAEGIDVDKAKSAAWFKRSGDQGLSLGADLYDEINNNNELNEEDKIKAEKLIDEFKESDSKLLEAKQTIKPESSAVKVLSNDKYSQQKHNKTDSMQTNTVLTEINNSYSPMRTGSGEYSYVPEKLSPSHYLPEKE
jgi:hypothetical protein